MEIRSVTLFVEPDAAPEACAPFLADARSAFSPPVQSLRLATTPFPDWWGSPQPDAPRLARLVTAWKSAGIDYLGLGPVQLRHEAAWMALLTSMAGAEDAVFVTAEIADRAGAVDLGRAAAAAALIRQLSRKRSDGFGNLFFAALAGCGPGAPFLPVAYHAGGPPRFALAMEAADLAVEAFATASSLAEAQASLVAAIEGQAASLTASAEALAGRHGVPFDGLDFTLAPYPEPGRSLGTALEALGVASVGGPGSLFAAAFVADCIDRAQCRRCGFSGLMLPVLEDATLAARAADGSLAVGDLLAYSAVCGTGLDTIPLPGDVSEAALAGLLLDLAGLSTRAGKPLTARLLPLPGLAAGDEVIFDFPYFADSRAMRLGDGVRGLLAGRGRLALGRIHGENETDGR